MKRKAPNVGPFDDRRRRSTAGASAPVRPGSAYTAVAVLGIALLISIIGSIVTYVQVRTAYARHSAVDRAATNLDELFRAQLEEDTGLRGYLASGQRLYLVPYSVAQPQFDETLRKLQVATDRADLHDGDAVLADIRHVHDRWAREVALPLIGQPNAPDALVKLQYGKALVDRMSADFQQLIALYERESTDTSDAIESSLRRAAFSTASLILLFGLAAIVADLFRSRTLVALERERIVTDTLQRAFLSGWDQVPRVRVGTAYVSSTSEAAVGGDLFDVHRIDQHRTLLLVADVSGKGIGAAVETAQVKYSVRTLVEDYTDPAVVLGKFNRSLMHSLRDPSSFVSAFVGILDDRDWTLRYASAGHAPAYVRRGGVIDQLSVTGPVLGVTDDVEFASGTATIAVGDTVVLATDGLTEARDSAGVMAGDESVTRWIRDGARDPEDLAAELVERVRRFSGGRISDDLAVLIISVASRTDAWPASSAAGISDAAASIEPVRSTR